VRNVRWLAGACWLAIVAANGLAAVRHATGEEIRQADQALLSLAFCPDPSGQAALNAQRARIVSEQLLGGLPVSAGHPADEFVLIQPDYVIWYDETLRVPLWVAYRLTSANLAGPPGRVEAFRPDPRLRPEQRAELCDYADTGFDRGHMAPDADFTQSVTAKINTYILSNMCPQHPNFNRKIWQWFEGLVRDWAQKFGSVYVITGAIFDRDGDGKRDPDAWADRVGPRGAVALPTGFYKIIVRKDGAAWDALAVKLSHKDQPSNKKDALRLLTQRITSIDAIEKAAATDFFPELPDEQENRLEREKPRQLWQTN
jgi:endonuclease G